MSDLKQEHDSPLQLNTEECTFHFSFYIFVGPLTCSRLKIYIALRALSWKYLELIERKSAGKKFCATFYEFKVYIFFLKVLLYLLIIFWKVRIDTLYEENGCRKISPGGIPALKIYIHQTLPWKTFPRKIATHKILTWNISTITLIVFINSLIISLIILREGNSVWE